jgi:hypothetical protein
VNGTAGDVSALEPLSRLLQLQIESADSLQ